MWDAVVCKSDRSGVSRPTGVRQNLPSYRKTWCRDMKNQLFLWNNRLVQNILSPQAKKILYKSGWSADALPAETWLSKPSRIRTPRIRGWEMPLSVNQTDRGWIGRRESAETSPHIGKCGDVIRTTSYSYETTHLSLYCPYKVFYHRDNLKLA